MGEWVYTAAGIGLGAAALASLTWSLFSDRPSGRRRCPTCWYDMSAVPGLTCPECGSTARSERGLFRTRRRWRSAAAATLVILGAVITSSAPRILADGWGAIVPLPLLELAARLRPSAGADAYA